MELLFVVVVGDLVGEIPKGAFVFYEEMADEQGEEEVEFKCTIIAVILTDRNTVIQ